MSGNKRPSPPVHSRFRKGQSGNPKGRPRKAAGSGRSGGHRQDGSSFDILLDQTLTVTHNGKAQEVGIEEALLLRTYQDALAGSPSARREILRLLTKREEALARQRPKVHRAGTSRTEHEAKNADAALLLLGIACEDTDHRGPGQERPRLKLENWAVQIALGRRRGGTRLSPEEVRDIQCCTRNPDSLRWPRGTRNDA
jgi:hypothetical protein